MQPYEDRKRFAWVLSLLVPLSIATGPLLWFWYPHTLMLWLPVFFVYGVAPALDWMLGTDTSNPPESAVPGLEADPYYRRVTFALVPLLWAAFIGAAWFSQVAGITWVGLLGLIISTGGVGGFCINLGHEIGHKRAPLERWLAKLILAPTFYGHFTIEHNRGHHRDVATPQDPASSRMGESIWRFVWREMPGAWRRAWALERERTRLDGQAFWSWHNEILQPAAITVALWAALCVWLGPQVLGFWCWRRCGRTFSSHRPTTSSTTACFASRMLTAGLKPASRSILGTATTCSPTGRPSTCSATRTTTPTHCGVTSRCGTSTKHRSCPVATSACSPSPMCRLCGLR